MSSKLLVALVVGVILTLAVLLAWPDSEVRESLRVSAPGEARATVTVNRVLTQPGDRPDDDRATRPASLRTVDRAEPETNTEAAAPEPTVTLTIHARLVDSSGEPISTGELIVPEFGARTHSDADGRVTIRFKVSESWEADSSELYLRAEAPSYGTLRHQVRLADKTELWLGDIVLKRAVRIEGQVLDSSGTPVEGATVVASDHTITGRESNLEAAREYGPNRQFDAHEPLESRPHTTTTDSNGRFLIEDFFAEWATVYARKSPSRWTFKTGVSMLEEQTSVEIELTLESPEERDWIRGRVQSTAGEPLASIRVELINADEEAGHQRLTRRTDEDGNFAFLVARESSWNLTARPEKWARDSRYLPDIAAGTEALIIVLPDTEWFWASVTDEEGNPQTEGRVLGFSADWYEQHQSIPHAQRVVSDLWDDGRARLRVTDNRIYLAAQVEGFSEKVLGPFAPGWSRDVQFTLSQKPMLRGVVSMNGRPLSNATVSLHRLAPNGKEVRSSYWQGVGEPFTYDAYMQFSAAAECAKKGQFQLEHPTSNKHTVKATFILRARSPSAASAEIGPYSLDELRQLRAIEIELSQGGTIQGKLELPESEDLTGWTVLAMSDRGELREQAVNERGTFSLKRLRPGPWQLRAFEPGVRHSSPERLRERQDRRADARVVEGQTVHANVEVELEEPVVLRGRLVLAGETPQAWRVRLYDNDMIGEMLVTDAQGRFEFEVREPGEWQLMLSAKNWDSGLFEISDTLNLLRGTNTWEHELELGAIELRPSQTAGEDPFSIGSLLHRGVGDLKVIQALRFRESGEYRPVLFPLGKLELLDSGIAWGQEPRVPGFVTREYELLLDETLSIELRN